MSTRCLGLGEMLFSLSVAYGGAEGATQAPAVHCALRTKMCCSRPLRAALLLIAGSQPGLLPPRWKRGRQGERGGRERRPVQVREEHFPGVRLRVAPEPVRAGCKATEWVCSFTLPAAGAGRKAATGGGEHKPVTGRQAPTSQFWGSAQGGGGPKSPVLRSVEAAALLQAGGSGGL